MDPNNSKKLNILMYGVAASMIDHTSLTISLSFFYHLAISFVIYPLFLSLFLMADIIPIQKEEIITKTDISSLQCKTLTTQAIWSLITEANAQSTLNTAAYYGRRRLVRKILHAFPKCQLDSALFTAVFHHSDMHRFVLMLVRRGANIHTMNNAIFEKLHDRLDLLEKILSQAQNVSLDSLHWVLREAIRTDELAMVKLLVKFHVGLTFSDYKYAIEMGHDDILGFFIESDFHPEFYDLITAAMKDHLAIVKRLISMGYDYRKFNDQCFRWAAMYGALRTVKYLLKLDPKLIAVCKKALVAAAENGHLEVVQLLLCYVTDEGAIDESYLAAIRNDNLEVVKLFADIRLASTECQRAALIIATGKGSLPIIQHLARGGIDLKLDGEIAICRSAEFGHVDVLKYLLSQGLSISRVTKVHANLTTYVASLQDIHKSFDKLCIKAARRYVASHDALPNPDIIPLELTDLLQSVKAISTIESAF